MKLLAFLILAALVWVNVWYRRERAKMTPEQREREDNEMIWW